MFVSTILHKYSEGIISKYLRSLYLQTFQFFFPLGGT